MRRGLICVLLLAAAPAFAAGPELALGAGIFDTAEGAETFQGDLELRSGPGWRGFGLAAGLMANEDGALYVYGTFRRPFPVGRRWELAPAAGVGVYERGSSKVLGGTVEFRTAIEATYEISPRSRLGVVFYHLSNAGIYDRNPGVNSFIALVAFDL